MEKYEEIREAVRSTALGIAEHEPGYAQEAIVMTELRKQFGELDVEGQQFILECWHELFANGTLSWGYDFDNPSRPFFHRTVRQPVQS